MQLPAMVSGISSVRALARFATDNRVAALFLALALCGCSQRQGLYEARITVQYRGELVSLTTPFECRSVNTIDWSGTTQNPAGPQVIDLPDGSVAAMDLSLCDMRGRNDQSDWSRRRRLAEWKRSLESPRLALIRHHVLVRGDEEPDPDRPPPLSWPMLWADRRRQPRIIEKYVSPAYYASPMARIRPIDVEIQPQRHAFIPSLWLSLHDLHTPAIAKGGTISDRFRDYCGVAAGIFKPREPKPYQLSAWLSPRIKPTGSPDGRPYRSPNLVMSWQFAWLEPESEDGEAFFDPIDPVENLRPMQLTSSGRFRLVEPSREPGGFIRLYRIKSRPQPVFDYNSGLAFPIGDDPIRVASTGEVIVPQVVCPQLRR